MSQQQVDELLVNMPSVLPSNLVQNRDTLFLIIVILKFISSMTIDFSTFCYAEIFFISFYSNHITPKTGAGRGLEP